MPARTQGKGRTVRQQWYGGTEGSPWDSLQSLPGLRGREGLRDSSGMVGLRGLPSVPARTQGKGRTVRQQWYGGTEGTPFSPCQDSGEGKDCETAVVWWD